MAMADDGFLRTVELNPFLKQRFLSDASSSSSSSIPDRFARILDSFRALILEERDSRGQEEEEESMFSPTQRKRVAETVLACAVLELEMDRICALPSETERIKFISCACGINAEPGFCEGGTATAVWSVLESRISTLCNAFDVVSSCKGKGKNLAAFFKDAFRGDPCLNGRLLAIQRFAFEEETGLSADFLTQQDAFTDHDDIAFKFTELMYGISFEEPPSQGEFEDYLRHQADYEQIYKPWVESPLFPQLYSRARELFT